MFDSSTIAGFVCVGLIGVLVLCLFMLAKAIESSSRAAARTAAANRQIQAAKEAKYIAMPIFQQLRIGMTFDEVVAIAGPPEKEIGAAGFGDVVTQIYFWRGGIFAHAHLTFADGKLIAKNQIGL